MSSNLFLKTTYLNSNFPIIRSRVIIEYDLRSANTSLCREYKLLDEKTIEKIEKLPKKDRVVKIGKLQRKDKKFNEGLKNAFIDIRRRFFEDNELEDDDILSIKKDAIFCLKEVKYTDFGDCHFVTKNVYTSYLYIKPYEIYYNSKGDSFTRAKIDVKGIDEICIEKHKEYMMKFFEKVFYHMEISSTQTLFNYIRRFVDEYKNRELDVGYYREFNPKSVYYLNDSEESYDNELFIPYEDKVQHIDIDYNFFQIIIPLINLLI